MFMYQQIQQKKNLEKKNDANKTKGVGGFRPVINYRDISIRKKKLADRQILICILTTGTLIVLIGLVLLFLGLFVINRQCPFNWLNFIDDTCLYVSSHNASWDTARDFCEDQGGNLVDIADVEENDQVKSRLKGSTWIALFRQKSISKFEWASGSADSYRNWRANPSPNAPGATECVKMDHDSGGWNADDCTLRYFAACEYKKSYYPLVLIGPIVIVCGLIVLILSIEVCQRFRKSMAKSKAKGLIANEELPEEDAEHFKKAVSTGSERLKGPWSHNKTGPLQESPSIQVTSSRTPHMSPVNDAWASKSPSKSHMSPAATSIKSITETPNKTPKGKKSSQSANLLLIDDQSKSQEQLELLLTPKNLK